MHPAFQLQNLRTLPAQLQQTADLLLSTNLTRNFERLNEHWVIFKADPENIRCLLPVWYANLDPTTIPTVDAMNAAEAAGHRIDAVSGAADALRFLPFMGYSSEGFHPELWNRAWFWMEFLHTFQEHLLVLPPKAELYATFVSIFVHFLGCGCSAQLRSTPGVRIIMGAAWHCLLDNSDDKKLRQISRLINGDEDKRHPHWMQEYMEGIGGGLDHFASLLCRQVTRAVVNPTKPMSDTAVSLFNVAIGFMLRDRDSEKESYPLREALLPHGILRALTAAIFSLNLSATGPSKGLYLLTSAFNVVGSYIAAPPGLKWMSEALQSGFLHAIVLVVVTHPGHEYLEHELRAHLRTLFSAYLVYRSILVLMPNCLAEVAELVKSDVFISSTVYPEWQRFDALAQERLAFLQTFESTPSVVYKACDNMKCREIRVKSDLRRCSICLDLYYCSRQCQLADWQAEHRALCRKIAALRALPEERQCTVQEKSFLRALLHRDYLALRAQIYTQQITLWAQTPNQVCYTVFDYTHGPVTVTVYPWGEGILDHPPSWMARCHNHILRVFKEPGLLEIHCMAIPNGLKTYRRLFSMRHADSQIFNALQEVSERMQEIPRTDPGFNSIIADGLTLDQSDSQLSTLQRTFCGLQSRSNPILGV